MSWLTSSLNVIDFQVDCPFEHWFAISLITARSAFDVQLEFDSWIRSRRQGEEALVGVITEAHVQRVSTRKAEKLVRAQGIDTLSKSEVRRLCTALR